MKSNPILNSILALIICSSFISCTPKSNDEIGQRESINFNWKFKLGADKNTALSNIVDTDWKTLNLPHDWGVEGRYKEDGGDWQTGYLPYGIGFYKKSISYNPDWKNKQVFIDFDGVYINSTVYVNDEKVGFYPNGYLGFSYNITSYLKEGENVIAVKVDNEKGKSGRWYTGNGIYRNVWLRTENNVHIPKNGIHFKDLNVSKTMANIVVSTEVSGLDNFSKGYSVAINLYDKNNTLVFSNTAEITLENKNKVVIEGALKNPKLWSPDTPNVYVLKTELKKGTAVIDKESTIVGVRSLEFNGDKGFVLNGVQTKLKGVCEHHTAGAVGAAIPNDVLYRRLKILKDMGTNAIRTSHNPFAPEFYTICDTLGIMVMDEMFDGWDTPKADNDYGLVFNDYWESDVESFLKRDRNHPSIIMWSIGNEVRNPTRAVQKQLIEKFKKFDDRPITQGGHDPTRGMAGDDLPTQLDVKGFNGDGEEQNVFEDFHAEHPSIPMVGTEVPHTYQTRGVYRTKTHWRRRDFPASWELQYKGKMGGLEKRVFPIEHLSKEEVFKDELSSHYYQNGAYLPIENEKPWAGVLYYQSSYDNASVRSSARKAWQRTRDLDYVMGQFRWGAFDYLGETNYWPSRFANFGIIDIAGFPKDHFYLLQSLWTTEPMVHLLPHWNHEGKEGVEIPVVVYTNCKEVELFLNGKSLGKQQYKDEQLVWQVPYEAGTIKAVAYKNGEEVATKAFTTADKPAKLNISADKVVMNANGRDVIHFEVDITDKNNVFVPNANIPIHIKLEGPAEIIGTDNGDPLDVSDYKTPNRRTFNGKALYMIQHNGKEGDEIRASFSSEGMENKTFLIKVNK